MAFVLRSLLEDCLSTAAFLSALISSRGFSLFVYTFFYPPKYNAFRGCQRTRLEASSVSSVGKRLSAQGDVQPPRCVRLKFMGTLPLSSIHPQPLLLLLITYRWCRRCSMVPPAQVEDEPYSLKLWVLMQMRPALEEQEHHEGTSRYVRLSPGGTHAAGVYARGSLTPLAGMYTSSNAVYGAIGPRFERHRRLPQKRACVE